MLNLPIPAFVHFQVPSTFKLVDNSFINLWLPFYCDCRLHESQFCQLPPECHPYHLNVKHTVICKCWIISWRVNHTSCEDSGVSRSRKLSRNLLPPIEFKFYQLQLVLLVNENISWQCANNRPEECWAGVAIESLAGREPRCLPGKRMCPLWLEAGFCWLFPDIINNGVKIISGLRGWEWYYYGHSRSISFHLNSTIVFSARGGGHQSMTNWPWSLTRLLM